MHIVIFTAIDAEAKAIRRLVKSPVHVVGIRAVKLPGMLPEGTRKILMAGFGGALDPAMKIGDIVVDEPAGQIYTSDELITTAARKAELFARTGARVVDMENAIVREWALSRGLEFVGVRAVSDTADEAIDPAVIQMVDSFGRPRPGKIAAGLIRRPGLAATLARLARNSKTAGEQLARAVERLVIR